MHPTTSLHNVLMELLSLSCSWLYNFTPLAKHRTLTAEEAEEEWAGGTRVVNHFSIMLQRRLRSRSVAKMRRMKQTNQGRRKRRVVVAEEATCAFMTWMMTWR
ncbi:hypothetical protein INR49_011215 [Caranx melampygus]|nr:hypothetical protein INR49_011215 [Caranx melampygus]